MTDRGSDVGPRGKRFDTGEGRQTLAQLQNTGAEVVGSDGQKIGDLKSVGDADFVVGRMLRSDLHVPVKHVSEVTTDNKIVLDVSADEAKEAPWNQPSTDTASSAESEGFSSSAKVEKGALEIFEDNSQETKQQTHEEPDAGGSPATEPPGTPLLRGGLDRGKRKGRGLALWGSGPLRMFYGRFSATSSSWKLCGGRDGVIFTDYRL